MAKRVYLDELRTLAFGGISAVYAPVGGVFTVEPRIICITNLTAGNVIFSDDVNSVPGKLILAAGGFKLFDLQSNMNPNIDDGFVMAKGTQMYVKQVTAPTSGAVYIELIYG